MSVILGEPEDGSDKERGTSQGGLIGMTSNKRSCFRLVYPLSMNPVFKTKTQKFRVIDLSEGGFSFWMTGRELIVIGDLLEGTISFGPRGSEFVKAEVLRIDDHRVSLQFSANSSISFSRMMEEQRALIQVVKQTV